jgi:hypothetical protein
MILAINVTTSKTQQQIERLARSKAQQFTKDTPGLSLVEMEILEGRVFDEIMETLQLYLKDMKTVQIEINTTTKAAKVISPILLIRDIRTNKVIIADGYHRTCALYHYDEEAWIPCKIVTLYPNDIK